MNGKKAKALRREVYGSDLSPRARKYQWNWKTHQIRADALRRKYQEGKRRMNTLLFIIGITSSCIGIAAWYLAKLLP